MSDQESLRGEQGRARFLAACSAALLAPLLRPLLTGRVFVYNDLSWFHLPMRYLYQQALQSGDSVLWTPSIFAGFYLHGEGQIGLFHPFHQLLYRVLPLGPAFNLELIANYVAAFAGMFWFLRRLRFARARRSSVRCSSRSAASTCCTTITSTWSRSSRTCRGCSAPPTS